MMLNPIEAVTFICPVFVTGGTEAIHQAAAAIARRGLESQIAYLDAGIIYAKHGDSLRRLDAAPPNACEVAFAAYRPRPARIIPLTPEHLVIVPEIHCLARDNFRPAQFAVWWLSVDNAFSHIPALSESAILQQLFCDDDVIHLHQSEYARRFLLESGARTIKRLTDVTDPAFLDTASWGKRDMKVLFNRKKGLDLAHSFFAAHPDLKPVALDGLSRAELLRCYAESAVYVDFGTLPGKDRMPREAAAAGCVVFVHNCGAGRELGDFPIRDHYRFTVDDVTTGRLADRVKSALAEPDRHRGDQRHFREVIAAEASNFSNDVAQLVHDLKTSSSSDHSKDQEVCSSVLSATMPHRQVLPRKTVGPTAFHCVWPDHADRHCIWVVSPKDYDHHRAFDEVALSLGDAFAERGGSAPVVRHPSEWKGRIPIVLGGHLLGPNMAKILPEGSIIFNMEQVSRDSGWLDESYLNLMRRHAVLDYSSRNLAALKVAGIAHARLLPPGYADSLSRIAPAPLRDIDVLFYGSLNERRAAVLDALRTHGLSVVHLFNVYGAERDAAIARAKLVLNLHFYDAAIFESPRVTYLLANRACVVTEGDLTDPDVAPYRGGLGICGYHEIVPLCLALLSDEPLRRALAEQGFAIAKRRRQADMLADLCASEGQNAGRGRNPSLAAVLPAA